MLLRDMLDSILDSIHQPGIILQPASGAEARRHFDNTVAYPVPIERMAPFLMSQDLAALNGYAHAG